MQDNKALEFALGGPKGSKKISKIAEHKPNTCVLWICGSTIIVKEIK
jgi:hypothetical protein